MPYKYVLKWYRGEKERLTIEAWNRYPLEKSEKPAFIIGKTTGSKVLLLRERVQKVIDLYGARSYGPTLRVEFPLDDIEAIAEAYRIGLASSVITYAPDNNAIQRASRYVLKSSNEEVWFWTSKLLDPEVGPQKTISALCIISGTWDIPKQGKHISSHVPKTQQVNLGQFSVKKPIAT